MLDHRQADAAAQMHGEGFSDAIDAEQRFDIECFDHLQLSGIEATSSCV